MLCCLVLLVYVHIPKKKNIIYINIYCYYLKMINKCLKFYEYLPYDEINVEIIFRSIVYTFFMSELLLLLSIILIYISCCIICKFLFSLRYIIIIFRLNIENYINKFIYFIIELRQNINEILLSKEIIIFIMINQLVHSLILYFLIQNMTI